MRPLALLLAAAALAGSACAEATGADEARDFYYSNTIFSDVTAMQAAPSGAARSPDFSWPATNHKHVACAVFHKRISVKQNKITNIDDVVWIWHSGLGQGRDGNVEWLQGASDPEGNPPPTALADGTWFWAVWALSDEGLPVMSTQEYVLEVPGWVVKP
jgi:hypothetical protein